MATAEEKKKKKEQQEQATDAQSTQGGNPFIGNSKQSNDPSNPQRSHPYDAQNAGAQPQQAAPIGKRSLGTIVSLFLAKWAWIATKKAAGLIGRIAKGVGTRLFNWVRPYAEDLFFNLVGQKGSVVVIRDRVTNEEIKRIIFDRKGRSHDGQQLDIAKIISQYKKDGYAQDVEISLYTVPDITYYQVIKDKPLDKSLLAESHKLREEMWNAHCKGTKGMDAAYKAFNRNQDIRYLQAEFKSKMDAGSFLHAYDMLKETMKHAQFEGYSKSEYLLMMIDEDKGNWISHMSEYDRERMLSVLRESSDRLHFKTISDYLNVEMASLSVQERVYVRLLLAGREQDPYGNEEAYNWVFRSLSGYDLEQEWAAKKGKFWELDSAEVWSLCMWANDCQATQIIDQQAAILLSGVSDVSDVSHLLGFFSKGDSPVSLYLNSVHEFMEASSANYIERRDAMRELYLHPDVQALELEKLNRMLSDKSLKDAEGNYLPDKVREIARVYANLSLANGTDLSEQQEKLKSGMNVLKSLRANELFKQEVRRAIYIKGDRMDAQGGSVFSTTNEPNGVTPRPSTADQEAAYDLSHQMDLEACSGVGVDYDSAPMDIAPTEEELVERAKGQTGTATENYTEAEVIESRPPLYQVYARFDKTAPNRPDLIDRMGLGHLSHMDVNLPRTTFEHLWSEAMALAKGLLTPQQIRDDMDSVSRVHILSPDPGHDIEPTLDKLLFLYRPFMDELATANGYATAADLEAHIRQTQQIKEVEQTINTAPPHEPSESVRMAQQTADALLKEAQPSVPDDFYAVMFDLPFPSKDGLSYPGVQETILQTKRMLAVAEAVKNNRCDPDVLMTLYREEPRGINGNTSLQKAEDVIKAIDELKVAYPGLKAENQAKMEAKKSKNNRSNGFKR